MVDRNPSLYESKELKNFLREKYLREYSSVSLKSEHIDLPDVPLSEVYVPPVIQEGFTYDILEQEKNRKRKGLNQKLSYVNKYRDLLTFTDKYAVGALVSGAPGCGKTTFCNNLLRVWSSPVVPGNENSVFIHKFEYVFVVRARHIKDDERLDISILQQTLTDRHSEGLFHTPVKNVLANGHDKVLVIVDGVDEWSGTPSYSNPAVFPSGYPGSLNVCHCVYIVTIRPFRLEINNRYLGRSFEMYEILGFNENGMNSYLSSLIASLNVEDEEKLLKDFLKQMDECKMTDMLWSPLWVKNLFTRWLSGTGFSQSFCTNLSGVLETTIKQADEETYPGGTATRLSICLVTWRSREKTDWDNSPTELPGCLSQFFYCNKYRYLLEKLSELAFEKIFMDHEVNAMIISLKDMLEIFPKWEANFILRSGVVDEVRSRESNLLRYFKLAFVSPSMHQFFAAVWMCNGSVLQSSLKYFQAPGGTLEELLELSVLIICVCGLDPLKGRSLCYAITEMPFLSKHIEQYRQSEGDVMKYNVYKESVVKLQELLILCNIEAQLSACPAKRPSKNNRMKALKQFLPRSSSPTDSEDSTPLYDIQDIFLDETLSDKQLEILLALIQGSPHQIKSLVVDGKCATPAEIVSNINKMCHMKRLHITIMPSTAVKELNQFFKAISKHPSLEQLGFHVVSEKCQPMSGFQCESLLSAVASMPSLRVLHLKRLSITSDEVANPVAQFSKRLTTIVLDRVTFMRDMLVHFSPKLLCLDLLDVSLPQPLLVPLNLTKLRIRNITLSHAAIQELLVKVEVLSHLNTITLEGIYCSNCAADQCQYHLNLSNCPQLTSFDLSYLYTPSVLFSPDNIEQVRVGYLFKEGAMASILEALPQSSRLTTLVLGDHLNLKLSLQDASSLQAVLPRLVSLTTLELRSVDFLSSPFILPTKLQAVRTLKLITVRMVEKSWRRFISSVLRPESGLEVILNKVNMDRDSVSTVKNNYALQVTWYQLRRDSSVDFHFRNTEPVSDGTESETSEI